MRSLTSTIVLAAVAVCVAGPARADRERLAEDTVVARVGDWKYTVADMRRGLARLDPASRFAAERRLPDYVRSVVHGEVMVREARRLKIDREPEVRTEIEEATRAILTRALIRQQVAKRALPSASAVASYYEQHANEFMTPERVDATEVVVADRTVADAVHAAAKRGESLERAAAMHAGSRLQQVTIASGVRDAELERELFTLEPGQVTGPSATSDGYSIFRVNTRHAAGVQPLATVRPVIESRLAAGNQERLFGTLQERLWQGQGVVMHDDVLKRLGDAGLSGALSNKP